MRRVDIMKLLNSPQALCSTNSLNTCNTEVHPSIVEYFVLTFHSSTNFFSIKIFGTYENKTPSKELFSQLDIRIFGIYLEALVKIILCHIG